MDKIPQVYQQRNTFYYKVNINGHRVTRKAEGSTLAQAQRHVDRLYRTNKLDSPTHASVLASFMDPETNPRYKDVLNPVEMSMFCPPNVTQLRNKSKSLYKS